MKKSQYYILDVDRRTPIPATLKQWSKWFQENDEARKVAGDYVGPVHISTVFLGLDHRLGAGPPDIYETMIFGGPLDQAQARCATHAEAEEQHKRMVAEARTAAADLAKILDYCTGPGHD